jgi:putative protease
MATEEKVGTVTDYYAKVGVAAITLGEGALQVGDRIRIRGHTTDVTQTIESLQVEHQPVQRAERGSQVAVKVRERVRKHDEVLRLTG